MRTNGSQKSAQLRTKNGHLSGLAQKSAQLRTKNGHLSDWATKKCAIAHKKWTSIPIPHSPFPIPKK
jgi:hypothetical protein